MACFVRNISHVKVPCRNRYMCLVSQFLLFLCMFIYIQTSTLNKSNAPFKRVGRCEGPCFSVFFPVFSYVLCFLSFTAYF